MSDTIFCTSCGAQNPADSRFCVRCGAEIRAVPNRSSSRPTPPSKETSQLPAADSEVPRPAEQSGVPTVRKLSPKLFAIIGMGALSLASIGILLQPGSSFDASTYMVPASYSCDYTENDGYGDESSDLSLEVGKQGWTGTRYDYDGSSETAIGTANYDPATDTLSVKSDQFEPLTIRGISALRFKEDAALSVTVEGRSDDGTPASATADLTLKPAGPGLEAQAVVEDESLSLRCTTETTSGPDETGLDS